MVEQTRKDIGDILIKIAQQGGGVEPVDEIYLEQLLDSRGRPRETWNQRVLNTVSIVEREGIKTLEDLYKALITPPQ